MSRLSTSINEIYIKQTFKIVTLYILDNQTCAKCKKSMTRRNVFRVLITVILNISCRLSSRIQLNNINIHTKKRLTQLINVSC